ncbi:hypothetical protein LEP48_01265 [Isoptericola sp. NEAU-Y5]|uniref:Uncharacterized protein n=1 Tax=Isoptericola luteus TaxID=2879484 RepID=A0ABS7ZDS3_9MICO|nr:hypothetical protein [Isoptericola sp. NEAU-Y5]MCA5891979.1 hypothetical protein [Isoptericola sp. NEAU-Y5]
MADDVNETEIPEESVGMLLARAAFAEPGSPEHAEHTEAAARAAGIVP